MSAKPRVALMADGTRGDFQPPAIAGRAMLDAGFEVLLAGGSDMAPMAADFGVPFVTFQPENQAMISDPDVVTALTHNDLIGAIDKMEKFKEKQGGFGFAPGMRVLYAKLKEFKPDIIMSGLTGYLDVVALANVLDCAGLFFGFQTTVPSKHVSALGVLPNFPAWTGLNLHAWKFLANQAVYKKFTQEHLPVYEELSGKSREEFWPTFNEWFDGFIGTPPPFPLFLSISPTLASPLPADFSAQHLVLGSLLVDPSQEKCSRSFGSEERSAMEAFLAKGTPPVYIGFGSITCHDGKWMTLLSLRALRKTGHRGIICAGYAGMSPKYIQGEPDEKELAQYVSEHVLFMQIAPHCTLFPRCKVLVHHGGAGTFGVAMTSGVPSVICPIISDQFEHAKILNDKGAGVGLKELKTLTDSQLAAAIQRAASEECRQKCAEVAMALKKEDGRTQLVEAVGQYYREKITTGEHRALVKENRLRFKMEGMCCGPLSCMN